MIKKAKGTKDILPSEVHKWLYVEEKFRDVCAIHGYKEIRTPMFEFTKLFKRGVGETTDIVQKEMYTAISGVDLKKYKDGNFNADEKGFTLKPEGTAPVMRAFTENKLFADSQPTKMYYITPCFRHERPQAGRLRQFHQFGIEALSSNEASIDAEVIGLADMFIRSLGINNVDLKINSIGCSECRPRYHTELKAFLTNKLDKLCPTCHERYDTNPMRILDCKNDSCQEELVEAPVMLSYLCSDCSIHFESLQAYLEAMETKFIVDPRIVRGLDYYTKTAFEFISGDIGAQSTVCGGGRYDGLVEQVGGPPTPGVGFGMGIERLLMTLDGCGIEIPEPDTLDVFIVNLDEIAIATSLKVSKYLRMNGVSADNDHLKRSSKAQFKYLDKRKAKFTIKIGEQELESGTITLRNMNSGQQVSIGMDELIKIVEIVKGRD